MTCYRWDRIIHLGTTTCLLCRQQANPGSLALDLTESSFAIPRCTSLCMSCVRTPTPTIWLHQQCYKVLEDSYGPANEKPTFDDVRKFSEAIKPMYDPHGTGPRRDAVAIQEGLLCPSTRLILKDSFRQDLFAKLPVEIQAIISELLTGCWYLVLLGETRRLIDQLRGGECAGKGEQELDLRRNIYVAETYYRGNPYISKISNFPLRSLGQTQLKSRGGIRRVVLSLDHIGVRRVQLLDENSEPLADGSPWYEILEVPDSATRLRVTYDGLFVKQIGFPQNDILSHQDRIWSSPKAPQFHPWNVYRTRDGGRCHYVRLDPTIQGLVVCCSEFKLTGIYAFAKVSADYKAFVDAMTQRFRGSLYWFYFPISCDEHVEGAWVRKANTGSTKAATPTLIIQTTRGRTATFGSHIQRESRLLYDFNPLVRQGDGAISGIFYNGLDPDQTWDISEIGVTCDNQYRTHSLEPQLHLDSYIQPVYSSRECYMTHAPLDDLLRVRVCRHTMPSQQRCLGLLLQYKDGRTECIGQFRWDCDVSQEISAPILIQSRKNISNIPYVTDVQEAATCSWSNLGSDEWQALPEEGVITWWFGALGDRIVINPDQSM